MLFLAMAGLAAGMLSGCGGEKKDTNIIAPKIVRKAVSAPVRMQEYTQTREIEWGGGRMLSEIHRMADDSLAMVSDEAGQKFVDNRIRLVVRRADGSVLLERMFTKNDFSAYLDDDYRKTGILEGLVFDKVDGGVLKFAASVCHPQTDEYIPLVVSVSRAGNVSIARDTQMDINSEE